MEKRAGNLKSGIWILAVHVRFFREVLFSAKIFSLVTQPFLSKPVLRSPLFDTKIKNIAKQSAQPSEVMQIQ